MKVIRYGKIKPKVSECDFCVASLEYTPKDIVSIPYYDYRVKNKFVITCPVCNGQTEVGEWEDEEEE